MRTKRISVGPQLTISALLVECLLPHGTKSLKQSFYLSLSSVLYHCRGVYARMSSGIDWIEEMIDQWSDYPRNIYETEGLINSNVSVGGENATLYPLV